ncbi:hypothetical protein AD938_00220, partial [Gluconobacter japonicus]
GAHESFLPLGSFCLHKTRGNSVGEPSDMGRIIAALATGKLPYTTGQVISADAGMLVPRF